MIYSTLLFQGALPLTPTTFYTVASGVVVVIRDIEILQYGPGTPSMEVYTVVSGFIATVINVPAAVNLQSYQWKGRVVVPAGGQIGGACVNTQTQAIVSGYVLS